MSTDDYKEIADELDSLIRAYRDPLNLDPRVLNPLTEALQVCRTRYHDAVKET